LETAMEDESLTLRIYRGPDDQWSGRLMNSAGQEVGSVVDGDSPDAVEHAANDLGIYPERILFEGMTIESELKALDKADADIEAAHKRIERQSALVIERQRDGHDVSTARNLLRLLRDTLAAMIEHREIIAGQIERLNAKEHRDP
jgi:hypothetical protein